MNYQLNEKKLMDFRGIRFRTWLYFFAMTVVILAILLLVQTMFFAGYYSTMKKNDTQKLGETIVAEYKKPRSNEEFKKYIYQTMFTSGSTIVFFKAEYEITGGEVKVKNDTLVNLLTSDDYGGKTAEPGLPQTEVVIDTEFFKQVSSGKNEFLYITNLDRGSYVIFGAQINDASDGLVYLHISSPLAQSTFITDVIRRQSVISTVLCALLSLGLSWIISSRIARPVSQFSKTARKLAAGDFSVRFEGEGFSEIEDLASTLNYATEEMGKTDQLRRDLLANVSHDLRTPLTMVKAYAEMIRDLSGSDPVKRANHCQTIIDEADRLTSLVNDIQNLSKLQSGTETAETAPLDLSALTRSVMERFEIYSAKEGYLLKQEIDDECYISADSKKIEQVLYNLIGNAINYTGEDKTVTVYVRNLTGKIYFGVRDTGNGIAKEEINNVWERYYRASQSKRKRIGSGLGLSIVKNILILHKAEYGVQSTLGEGSTFWFSMPQFDSSSVEKQRKNLPVKNK